MEQVLGGASGGASGGGIFLTGGKATGPEGLGGIIKISSGASGLSSGVIALNTAGSSENSGKDKVWKAFWGGGEHDLKNI